MDSDFAQIPCLVCNTVVKCDDQLNYLSVKRNKDILFLLGNLLEIAKPRVILNGEGGDYWDDGEDDNRDNYWTVVEICEKCETAVGQASLIYGEIWELVRKFREIQRKLVKTFKKSCESTGAANIKNSYDDSDKRFYKLINQFRGIIKSYDYNEFGFPFIVKDENEVVPVPPADHLNCRDDIGDGDSSDEEDKVIVKNETSEPQQILLIFPERDKEEQMNIINSDEKDDLDDEEDDDSEDEDYIDHPKRQKLSKPEKVRKAINHSPKEMQRRERRQKAITNPLDIPWPCPLCPFKLKTFRCLKSHLSKNHPNNSIDFNALKLKYLQVNPPPGGPPPPPEVLRKAARHLRVSPFELQYPHLCCKRNSERKFPCPWTNQDDDPPFHCLRIFGDKYSLIKHLKVDHLKIPLHICNWSGSEVEGEAGAPVCGRTFANRQNYKDHLDEHRGTPRWKCEDCDMTFYKRNYFTRHTQKMHLNERFICEICGVGFPCKDNLYNHRNVKHKDNPREKTTTSSGSSSGIICDLCGKLFKSDNILKIHREDVHEKVKGKWECHLCEMGWRWKSNLNKHLWEKHGFKAEGFEPKERVARKDRFQCEVTGCRMVLSSKEGLEKHRIKFHGEDGKKPGPWNCKYCGKNFFQRIKFEQCERTHENKERRPEKCEVCGKGFPTKDHLKFHLRHTHKLKLERETRRGRKEQN